MRLPRWTALGAAGVFLLFAACSQTQVLEKMKEGEAIPPGEVVLVGKIFINPPLGPSDQDVDPPSLVPEKYKEYYEPGGMSLGIASQYVDYSEDDDAATISRMEYTALGKFGQMFAVHHPLKSTYLVYLSYLQTNRRNRIVYVHLPASFRIPVSPGDRAVYIGTLRYERNEYGDITSISVVDNLAHERAEIEKKVGKRTPIAKRLAIPLDKNGKPTVAANIPGVRPPRAAAAKSPGGGPAPQAQSAEGGVKFTPLSDDDAQSSTTGTKPKK
jgi:hypothetical protein